MLSLKTKQSGRMEKTSWTPRVKYEELLHRVEEDRNILHKIKKGRITGLVSSYVGRAS
jgi:hypothetical protein